jgi:hypothetical protein
VSGCPVAGWPVAVGGLPVAVGGLPVAGRWRLVVEGESRGHRYLVEIATPPARSLILRR